MTDVSELTHEELAEEVIECIRDSEYNVYEVLKKLAELDSDNIKGRVDLFESGERDRDTIRKTLKEFRRRRENYPVELIDESFIPKVKELQENTELETTEN